MSNRQLRLTELYPRVATDLLNPLVDVLTIARGLCGGDMDKFLIMLAVAVRTMAHPRFKTFSQAELLAGRIPLMPSLGTNLRSVATSVGIPKETARRKVEEMIQAGWLIRVGRDIRFTPCAYQQFTPVRESIERLALRIHDVIATVVGP